MKLTARIARITSAAAVGISLVLFSSHGQAQEAEYSKVGWWQISYRQVDTLSGCQATMHFEDQTELSMALIQGGDRKGWTVYVYNPHWTWIKKNTRYVLFVWPIKTNKLWRDAWSVADDYSLYLTASVDFMNSIVNAKALAIFDENKRLLTLSPLDMKDSEAAIRAVVMCSREHPAPGPSEAQTTSFSGTAFFVVPNLLVTNDHVVKECRNDIQVRYPDRKSYTATLLGLDETNDLALLSTEMSNLSVATFRLQPRFGESIATYGFPDSFVLSSGGNFTLGNVTSLSGMKDDSRFIQISAPIQPGNSGGPLLDMFGNVIGIVQTQLNAIAMMQYLRSAPQNVNFAIQSAIVANFLSSKGVTAKIDNLRSHKDLPPSDVADLAKSFTVQIYCDASSSKTSQAHRPPIDQATRAD